MLADPPHPETAGRAHRTTDRDAPEPGLTVAAVSAKLFFSSTARTAFSLSCAQASGSSP